MTRESLSLFVDKLELGVEESDCCFQYNNNERFGYDRRLRIAGEEKRRVLGRSKAIRHREFFDEYKARNQNSNEIVLMARVKNGLDVKGIETRFPQLKERNNEHLVRYLDIVKQDEELWVVIPSRVDRIDCNGEL